MLQSEFCLGLDDGKWSAQFVGGICGELIEPME